MNAAAPDFAGNGIKPPEGVVREDVCFVSGLRATRYCQDYHRDPLTGEESYKATTLNELFVKGTAPSGYCDVHGVIDPEIARHHDFGPDDTQALRTHVIPVQPKEPLLLGRDPYGTEQPDFAPREVRSGSDDGVIMNFDQLEDADREASITLERPRRVEIYEE